MSCQESSVVKVFRTGQLTLAVSWYIAALLHCSVFITLAMYLLFHCVNAASRGFPWPLDDPYKVDPATGYPTDAV